MYKKQIIQIIPQYCQVENHYQKKKGGKLWNADLMDIASYFAAPAWSY